MNKATKRQLYRWLARLSARCRGLMYCSVFLGTLHGILIITQAYLLALIIYRAVMYQVSRQSLLHLTLFFLLIVVVRSLLSWFRNSINFKAASAVKTALREQLMQHLMAIGPVRLAAYQGGALGNTIVEQVEALHDFFANYLPQIFLVAILPLLILIVVFSMSWISGILLLVTAPLIPLFMVLVGMGAESRSQKQFHQMSRMSGYFLDVLRGLVTLKLFKQSTFYIKKIAFMSDEYRKKSMHVLRIAFLTSAVLELFSSIAIAMLAIYLGLSLLGLIHIGLPTRIITFQNALFMLLLAPEFFLPLRQLGTHYHARAQAMGAVKEIQKILTIKAPVSKHRGIQFFSKKPIRIIFEDVSFSYDDKLPLLNQFNLIIHPKEHTVIVGESGVGKSTILNLINGLITPTSGVIRVNGNDLRKLDSDSWRNQIAWVGQNTQLFHGSIRDNILLAKPTATQEELVSALQVAYLDDVIQRLPHGLDTRVGEQNHGLSCGQIQRIALSRAYLKNTSVLLLDEATANLDSNSEAIILTAIKAMSREKTVISVSHREQTISTADSLIYLGEVVEIA